MSKHVHYRGDTFELLARIQATVDGSEVMDFTGYTLASQIRDPKGGLIATLECSWIDEVQGVARLGFSGNTANWPLANALMNLRIATPTGKIISSDTFGFDIEESPTR